MNDEESVRSDEPADVLPELREIIGAMLFAAREPISVAHIRAVLQRTAEVYGGSTRDFALAGEPEIAAAIESLIVELNEGRFGVRIVEVAGGFRMENLPRSGPWVRQLLEKGRPNRLSQPALETLAIIAYRQPIVRTEIEAVRGVAVDQILRNLLDLQLIRIVGRSDLPGRPWLFGTTQKFLERFGLRSLEDLPGIEELRRINAGPPDSSAEEMNGGASESEPKLSPAADVAPPPTSETEADGKREGRP